jgi:hypothetical protein
MEQSIRVSFPTDADGFVSQQCPSCNRRFKIRVDDSGNAVSHCPYCGSGTENGWLTEEQRAYAMGVVAEQTIDPMMEQFSRSLSRMNRPGGFIKVSGSYKKSPRPPQPGESDEPMPVFTASCCNEPVKHDGSASELFCIVCGKRESLSA